MISAFYGEISSRRLNLSSLIVVSLSPRLGRIAESSELLNQSLQNIFLASELLTAKNQGELIQLGVPRRVFCDLHDHDEKRVTYVFHHSRTTNLASLLGRSHHCRPKWLTEHLWRAGDVLLLSGTSMIKAWGATFAKALILSKTKEKSRSRQMSKFKEIAFRL